MPPGSSLGVASGGTEGGKSEGEEGWAERVCSVEEEEVEDVEDRGEVMCLLFFGGGDMWW